MATASASISSAVLSAPASPHAASVFSPTAEVGQPRRKFRRSRTNRTIAGVAGGLGEYLGVDTTVLRVGFVIASLLFLGGLGGPVLYVIAWLVVPEEGKDSAVTKATFSGRPWQDWDRSARSWALVLGALALALIWSFGIWPWWHWRVLHSGWWDWLSCLWLLARHREGNWVSSPRPSHLSGGARRDRGRRQARDQVPGQGRPMEVGPASPDAGPPAYGPYVPDAPGPKLRVPRWPLLWPR